MSSLVLTPVSAQEPAAAAPPAPAAKIAADPSAAYRDAAASLDQDLRSALDELAAVWSPTMRVSVDHSGADLAGLAPSAMAAVLDIFTEGLLNARKHGEADCVNVVITDDGCG
ncbi:MAG: hypothetical protein NWT04_10255, partial [Verrucomicrobiales bacterium]|nr:hypothetical protein [Verrucomicrobiales bacterium]